MLSLILLILKIIGITILVLLGILLLLILLVLFVPIRYRAMVEHGDALELDGGVSWLLHIIHAKLHQSGNKRRIWIRFFGILIYDSSRPPKTKYKRKKTKRKATDKKQSSSKYEDIEELDKTSTISKDLMTEEKSQVIQESKDLLEDSINEESGHEENKQKDREHEENKHEERIEEESEGILLKLYNKIKAKILGFFRRIKKKIIELIQKFINIRQKISLVNEFLKDDINREGLSSSLKSLKRLFKHILPRRIKSELLFGTGDPCSTGQALGVLGILYGLYGDNLQITPDFENKVFIGSHFIKGRIRIWSILIIVIKLLLDKSFKELRGNYQLLKEAL